MLLLTALCPPHRCAYDNRRPAMTEIIRAERAELKNMVRHLDDDGVRLVHEAVDWVMTHPGRELPPEMMAKADAIATRNRRAHH